MFKWLTGIWQIVEELSNTAKTVFVFTVVFLVAGYFTLDRILDYQEATLIRSQPSSVENVSSSKYKLSNSDYEIKESNSLTNNKRQYERTPLKVNIAGAK